MPTREELLTLLQQRYIPARVERITPEFIQFEENSSRLEDLQRLLDTEVSSISNGHNSSLLYITGATDEYDFTKYVDTIGGSQGDIDLDFETQGFQRIIDWVTSHYGQDHVAAISTLSKFKPRSTVNKFFTATAPRDLGDGLYQKKLAEHYQIQREILDCIPAALFGKEPTLKECVEGNPDKGYPPHPQLATDPRYIPWYETAKHLEGMVNTYSIHAAGLVITDCPTDQICPTNTKTERDEYTKEATTRRVTQMPMEDITELGLTKYDMLRIENLSIIKQCIHLIQERHGITIAPYEIPDGDKAAYKLLASGHLGGIFQLEASETTKSYTQKIAPQNISEIADLSALARPGALQSGLTNQYIENKQNGYPPEGLHPFFAEATKNSFWTLCYQEDVMQLLSLAAGFDLQASDTIRRHIGKKSTEKLAKSRQAFINGCVSKSVDSEYAANYWDKIIIKQADYQFNKSHAVAYSYLTYICAYLKANYTLEFFTALMSVRSQTLAPKDWTTKAPTYVQEARHFGIHIDTPGINSSAIGFTIDGKAIHFGLNSIRQVGAGAAELLTSARGNVPFRSITNFLARVNRQKINIGVFNNLVLAGCFDSLGYNRQELLDGSQALYDWFAWQRECEDRKIQNSMRELENVEIQKLIEQRDEIRKRVKKKSYVPIEEDTAFLEQYKRLALKRPLVLPEEPSVPEFSRSKELHLSIEDLLVQGELIGCYLPHPARIAYPTATPIGVITLTDDYELAGVVTDIKTYSNPRGATNYVSLSDGTGSCRIPVYSNSKVQIPKKGDLISAQVHVVVSETTDSEDEIASISLKISKLRKLSIYQRTTTGQE